jgi:hypothetical protein
MVPSAARDSLIQPLALAGAVILAACGLMPDASLPPRPNELEQVGVRAGEGLLQKSIWLENASLGDVTSITDVGARGVLVAGTTAAAYVKDGTAGDRVAWSERASFVEPVDVDGDGKLEFLDSGGPGWQGAALLDGAGRPVFQPASRQGIDHMAAGHLDADGRLDFVVGHNGGSGVVRYDALGHELWRQGDANVWHVEIVDTNADGTAEVVHSNAAGQLTIRDGSGAVVRRVDPPGSYFSSFSLVQWPRSAPPRPIYSADGSLWIADYSGEVGLQLAAPGSETLGDARAVPIRLGKADHLAALVAFQHWDRTSLFVFDATGAVAYREVVEGGCDALAAVPGEKGDDLLLGCGPRTWRYRAQ